MGIIVPDELRQAIDQAAARYNVPAWVLVGIWIRETGARFPNPYVNSSGYGGLFGTTHWNTSTQDQAYYAASILRRLLDQYGNLPTALYHYSGGGYTSVSGADTTASPPGAEKGGLAKLYAKAHQFASEAWNSDLRDEAQVRAYIESHLRQAMPGYTDVEYAAAVDWAINLVILEHPASGIWAWFKQTPVGGTAIEAAKRTANIGEFIGKLMDWHTWLRVAEVAGGAWIGYLGLRMLSRETGVSIGGS